MYPTIEELRSLESSNCNIFLPKEEGGRGIECGPGWFDIIEDFLDKTKATLEVWGAKISLIKEKFGGIRIHISGSEEFWKSESGDVVRRQINDAVSLAWKTCEECGRSGRVSDIDGWMQCLCKTCKEKYIERRKLEKAEFERLRGS